MVILNDEIIFGGMAKFIVRTVKVYRQFRCPEWRPRLKILLEVYSQSNKTVVMVTIQSSAGVATYSSNCAGALKDENINVGPLLSCRKGCIF
jgi:hypothetical protein